MEEIVTFNFDRLEVWECINCSTVHTRDGACERCGCKLEKYIQGSSEDS